MRTEGSTMTQYPRRTEKKKQSRAQLTRAANTLFGRKGYQHTKLDEVAEVADLHVQTLYRHFKTKENSPPPPRKAW